MAAAKPSIVLTVVFLFRLSQCAPVPDGMFDDVCGFFFGCCDCDDDCGKGDDNTCACEDVNIGHEGCFDGCNTGHGCDCDPGYDCGTGNDCGLGYGCGTGNECGNGCDCNSGYDCGTGHDCGLGYGCDTGYDYGNGCDCGTGHDCGLGYGCGTGYDCDPGCDCGAGYGCGTGYGFGNGYDFGTGCGSSFEHGGESESDCVAEYETESGSAETCDVSGANNYEGYSSDCEAFSGIEGGRGQSCFSSNNELVLVSGSDQSINNNEGHFIESNEDYFYHTMECSEYIEIIKTTTTTCREVTRIHRNYGEEREHSDYDCISSDYDSSFSNSDNHSFGSSSFELQDSEARENYGGVQSNGCSGEEEVNQGYGSLDCDEGCYLVENDYSGCNEEDICFENGCY